MGEARVLEHWYCAEVDVNRSANTEKDLKRMGFRAFNPTCLERRFVQRSRRHRVLERPLFPGYLFIAHDPYFQVFQDMLKARGIIGLVKAVGSEMPARVDAGSMDRLLGLAAAGPLKDDRWMLAFAPGQKVTITEGTWAGWSGKVDRSLKERVWVFMQLFGRQKSVEVPAATLEAA